MKRLVCILILSFVIGGVIATTVHWLWHGSPFLQAINVPNELITGHIKSVMIREPSAQLALHVLSVESARVQQMRAKKLCPAEFCKTIGNLPEGLWMPSQEHAICLNECLLSIPPLIQPEELNSFSTEVNSNLQKEIIQSTNNEDLCRKYFGKSDECIMKWIAMIVTDKHGIDRIFVGLESEPFSRDNDSRFHLFYHFANSQNNLRLIKKNLLFFEISGLEGITWMDLYLLFSLVTFPFCCLASMRESSNKQFCRATF